MASSQEGKPVPFLAILQLHAAQSLYQQQLSRVRAAPTQAEALAKAEQDGHASAQFLPEQLTQG